MNKKKIMKKSIFILLPSLVLMFSLNVSAFALEENGQQNGKIYIPATIENQSVIKRTKGTCTDRYSREWCNAHGFSNNRPVPEKVGLNEKELRCYVSLLASGSIAATEVITLDPKGIIEASVAFAVCLWGCKF